MPIKTRRKIAKRPKRRLLIHHKHTGKLVHRRHTSYALLSFIMLLVGIFLASITWSVRADNISVSATVLGEPPPEAAIITKPVNDQHFSAIPIDVEGTCPVGNYQIKIYRNNVFSGATLCSAEGTFSLKIDLFEGKNELVARIFNGANVEGPTSPTVTVFYDPPAPATPQPTPTPGAPKTTQLLLKSDNLYYGYLIGERVIWPIEINGGTAPYALSVDWGDGNSDVISRSAAGYLELSHIYKQQGSYRGSFIIIIKASDSAGQNAYLQLVTIVNDPNLIAPTTNKSDLDAVNALNKLFKYLLLSWPVYLLAIVMIISFWLGERREFSMVRKDRRFATRFR